MLQSKKAKLSYSPRVHARGEKSVEGWLDSSVAQAAFFSLFFFVLSSQGKQSFSDVRKTTRFWILRLLVGFSRVSLAMASAYRLYRLLDPVSHLLTLSLSICIERKYIRKRINPHPLGAGRISAIVVFLNNCCRFERSAALQRHNQLRRRPAIAHHFFPGPRKEEY